MRIEVTYEDIVKGIQGDCSYCPITHAIHRALGIPPPNPANDEDYATQPVHTYGSFVGIKGKTVELPYNARMFIKYFDNRRPVDPIEFELDYSV